MTQDEIIEMARQAGFERLGHTDSDWVCCPEDIEAFANLVEEKVTERYMQLFLDPENQPTQFGTATQEYREQEIRAEREACAKEVEKVVPFGFELQLQVATIEDCVKAIRARGQAC